MRTAKHICRHPFFSRVYGTKKDSPTQLECICLACGVEVEGTRLAGSRLFRAYIHWGEKQRTNDDSWFSFLMEYSMVILCTAFLLLAAIAIVVVVGKGLESLGI